MPFLDNLRGVGRTMGEGAKSFGRMVGQGLEGAAATAVVGGVMMGGQKVYDHLTKARDFKNMLASPFNQDLQQHHDANPEKFNAAFTSLRRVNPALTKDPMVAGAYMRRTMEYDNAGATGVLVEALNQREKMPMSPIHDLMSRGAQMGVQGVYTDRVNRATDDRQVGVERGKLELRAGSLGQMLRERQREIEQDRAAIGIEQEKTLLNHRNMIADARAAEKEKREQEAAEAAAAQSSWGKPGGLNSNPVHQPPPNNYGQFLTWKSRDPLEMLVKTPAPVSGGVPVVPVSGPSRNPAIPPWHKGGRGGRRS